MSKEIYFEDWRTEIFDKLNSLPLIFGKGKWGVPRTWILVNGFYFMPVKSKIDIKCFSETHTPAVAVMAQDTKEMKFFAIGELIPELGTAIKTRNRDYLNK